MANTNIFVYDSKKGKWEPLGSVDKTTLEKTGSFQWENDEGKVCKASFSDVCEDEYGDFIMWDSDKIVRDADNYDYWAAPAELPYEVFEIVKRVCRKFID